MEDVSETKPPSSATPSDSPNPPDEVNHPDNNSERGRTRTPSRHDDNERSRSRTQSSDNRSNRQSSVGSNAKDSDDESDTENPPPERPINLGVQYYDYHAFINRNQSDNSDFTLEALMGPPNLIPEIKNEMARRRAFRMHPHTVRFVYPNAEPLRMTATSTELGEGFQLHRVRVRSPYILRVLAELGDWEEFNGPSPKTPVVYCRPFHAFRYFQDEMKRRLEVLESEAKTTVPTAYTPNPTEDPNAPPKSTPLEDMRCYVQFVEEKILPLWTRFDKITKETPRKIRYEEIPFLFRGGGLAYVPSSPVSTKVRQGSAIQNFFRMVSTTIRDLSYRIDGDAWEPPVNEAATQWSLYCLDHDGDQFKVIPNVITFTYFSGEKEISALPCYPLRLHPIYGALLEEQVATGKRFKDLISATTKHHYYSGWNLVTGMFKQEDGDIEEPEHVESEVIVDTKESSRHLAEFYPTMTGDLELYDRWGSRADAKLNFRVWEDEPKTSYFKTRDVTLIREDFTHFKEEDQYVKQDPFKKENGVSSRHEWSDDDLALLPRRIVGYVLRERKFTRLNVHNFEISPADEDQTTLDQVQMKAGHKTIIRSTVSSHFAKTKRERNHDNTVVYSPDIIRGKGRGLVILLHGAPGVGKTATAEAVALEFKKPLFPMTCGDLGTTPDRVEETLKKIFRYAHLWDCILLLDEADVFLTQRDRTDIERNALVSVFLRVLEYYSGILFLTTNRVGALDEAFRSRVHLSLYYPHLNCDDTIAILVGNLRRLPRADQVPKGSPIGSAHIQVMDQQIIEFVKTEYARTYKAHKRGPWNGRQIRNAVQIASCLAFFEKQSSKTVDDLPAVLTADHFRTVNDTIAEFDRYLLKARRVDDRKMAQMEGVRYDGFETGRNHQPVAYDGFSGFDSDNGSVDYDTRPTGRGSQRNQTPQGRPLQQVQSEGRFSGKYSSSRKQASRIDVHHFTESDLLDDEDAYTASPVPRRGMDAGGYSRSGMPNPRSRAQQRLPLRNKNQYADEEVYPDDEDPLEEDFHDQPDLDDARYIPRSSNRNPRQGFHRGLDHDSPSSVATKGSRA